MILNSVFAYLAAASGVGTAAFVMVESSKVFAGGVSNAGFKHVRHAIEPFLAAGEPGKFDYFQILSILRAHWINGTPLTHQKAIARSLIKVQLTERSAKVYADLTGVDSGVLMSIATKMIVVQPLTERESDVHGRFNLILNALLDEGYERADQSYRNTAKVYASFCSLIIALFSIAFVEPSMGTPEIVEELAIGVGGAAFAPIAKDVTSALQTTFKVMIVQVLRKWGVSP